MANSSCSPAKQVLLFYQLELLHSRGYSTCATIPDIQKIDVVCKVYVVFFPGYWPTSVTYRVPQFIHGVSKCDGGDIDIYIYTYIKMCQYCTTRLACSYSLANNYNLYPHCRSDMP